MHGLNNHGAWNLTGQDGIGEKKMKLDVSTVEGYNIACALRAPDLRGSHYLGVMITCPIRKRCNTAYSPPYNRQITDHHITEAAKAIQMCEHVGLAHWLRFCHDAAQHLGMDALTSATAKLLKLLGKMALGSGPFYGLDDNAKLTVLGDKAKIILTELKEAEGNGKTT